MDKSLMGSRLKFLRDSVKLSQAKLASLMGVTQTAINRYEHGQSDIPNHILFWYAEHFDVSLDYIFGRVGAPQGKLYDFQPKTLLEDEQFQRFIEMCFEPGSPANIKIKKMLFDMLKEGNK